MSIAITEEHRSLADSVSDFLLKKDARGAARALLESDREPLPSFWDDLAALGWLGLHLPEGYGGSGYGISALVVVVGELGRAMAPGPFLPTVIVSGFIAARATDEIKNRHLRGMATGKIFGAFALDTT